MNPQDPNPQPQTVNNPIAAMRPGEEIICEIKRHPVGLLGIFSIAGLVLIFLAIACFVLIPSASSDGSTPPIAIALFFLVAVLTLLFTYVSDRVYWGNRWVVTSDSITQIVQTGLFHKYSGQLSLESLEDITAEQNGVFQHMFGFGTLRAETAGERSKFVFRYCPKPEFYAQKILAARETFEQGRFNPNEDVPPQQTPQNPTPPVPPTPQNFAS
jgi:uncharacterized membrane protein YdbT with pleckstrin-like domain